MLPRITKSAQKYLEEKLREAGVEPGQAVRLSSGVERWRIGLDEKRPNDMTYESDGKVLLVVDRELVDKLTNKTLDVLKGEGGPALAVIS